MQHKTLKKILLVFVLCIAIKCLFPSMYVLADDLGENIPEIEIEAEAIGKNISSGGGQGFTIINDNLMANAIDNRAIFLVNKQNGQAYEESIYRRDDHCNTLTYDTKKQYLIAADGEGDEGADLYQVSDGESKTLTKVKHLNHAPGNGIGYDKVTGEFIGVGGHNIFAYKSEDFYAGKSPYKTFRITYDSSYRTIQSAEGYGGNVFYVMTDGMDDRKIDGNTILVINIEQEKPIMRLHWSESKEMEDCAFDSQGNLYFSTSTHYYKTNFNAYAEGNISATPSNLIESIANIVTYRINIFSDWLQSLLESLETEEDVSQINLTYSANEIITDESLQNIIQVEYVENESQEGSGQENTEQKNLKIDEEIKSKVDNKNGEEVMVYTNQTPIPSIKVSLDSACTNKLTLFDINFLDMSNTNQNKVWQLIKNVVYVSSRITLYLCVILLIGIIIYRSILLVLSTMGYKPKKAAESKKIIDNFITAIVIMIFVYVIIQLCINFYNFMLDFVVDKMTNGLNTPYIYRVKVSDIYYFNTNGMGYLKYMSLSSDIWGAFISSLVRLIFTLVNAATCLLMVARTILIGVLITLAPITAINYLAGRVPSPEMGWMNILFFKNFFKVFMMALWIPFLILFGSWMFFYII